VINCTLKKSTRMASMEDAKMHEFAEGEKFVLVSRSRPVSVVKDEAGKCYGVLFMDFEGLFDWTVKVEGALNETNTIIR
jgi:hypothetical protein